MSVTYRLRINEEYYRTLISRYYRQRPLIFQLYAQFGIVAFITAIIIVFGLSAPLVTLVATAIVIAAAIFFGGIAVTRWAIFQRFRYRADFGSEATIVVSSTGLVASGPHVEGRWDWAAYPDAVRFHDGLMLLRPGVIRWLPDSAIETGAQAEVTALARSNSRLRELG